VPLLTGRYLAGNPPIEYHAPRSSTAVEIPCRETPPKSQKRVGFSPFEPFARRAGTLFAILFATCPVDSWRFEQGEQGERLFLRLSRRLRLARLGRPLLR